MLRLLLDAGVRIAAPYGIVEITPDREYLLVTEFSPGRSRSAADIDDGVIDQVRHQDRPAYQQAERPGGRLHRSAALLPGHRRRGRGGLVMLGQQHHEDRPRPDQNRRHDSGREDLRPGAARVRGRHLWVITGRNGDQLTGIDAATNRLGPVIKLPVGCSDLAQGRALSGSCARSPTGSSRSTSPITRSRARSRSRPSTASAPDGPVGWIGPGPGPGRRQEPGASGAVRARQHGPRWRRGGRRRSRVGQDQGLLLYRIDARSDTVAEQIKPDGEPGGGSFLVAAGSIWTTADDVSNLLRLRSAG